MVRQTWELRYLVFLVIFLLITPTAQFPPTPLNQTDCTECSNSCGNKTLKQLDPQDSSCQKCGCLGSTEYLEEFKKTHPRNIPFLSSNPSLTVAGTNTEFTCIRWCDTDCISINAHNEMSLKSGSPLPDVRQQLLYGAQAGGFWLSILNLTLTVDAANTFDELQCQVRGNTNSSNIAKLTLFAFDMSQPVVTGPKSVKTTSKFKWNCLMDFVTVRVSDDVTNRLDFEVEILDAGSLRATTSGLQYTQKQKNSLSGVQVTKALTLTIPKRLANTEFEVQCTAVQKELWVVNSSLPLRVSVTGEKAVVEIGSSLTTSGVTMGSVAVIIAISFAVHYVLRKHQARDLPRFPNQEQPQLKRGGILKNKNAQKSALKRGGMMSKAYSALTEEEPESTMADAVSIEVGDIADDASSQSSQLNTPAPATTTTTTTTTTDAKTPPTTTTTTAATTTPATDTTTTTPTTATTTPPAAS